MNVPSRYFLNKFKSFRTTCHFTALPCSATNSRSARRNLIFRGWTCFFYRVSLEQDLSQLRFLLADLEFVAELHRATQLEYNTQYRIWVFFEHFQKFQNNVNWRRRRRHFTALPSSATNSRSARRNLSRLKSCSSETLGFLTTL